MEPKTVKHAWDNARGWYHFPPLKSPRVISDLEGGACYDFRKKETLVSEKYVDELSTKSGLTIDRCLEGILCHEIGHYMVFPRTLGTLVLAAKMVDDFFGKKSENIKEFILQTYADMANDTASVLEEQRTNAILEVRTAMQDNAQDKTNESVRAVMLAYLYRQAGRKYELNEDLKPFFERMLEIDFLKDNPESMRLGIWVFGNIILDILNTTGGEGHLSGDGHSDSDVKDILRKATPQDVKEALREVSYRITRKEYEKVKEWIKENGGRLDHVPKSGQIASIGTSEGELPVDEEVLDYYLQLSKQYPLVVTKKPLPTKTSIRAFSDTERWRAGSDPLLTLPHTSGGMLLPGITKKVRITERKIRSRDYKVPNLLVVVDSSGSTPDPKYSKSYFVLGGYCSARSYHSHDASIGVINFSGNSFYLPYTRELMQALGAISAHQGGGTTVDLELLRKMLGPEMFDLYKTMPERDMRGLPREVLKKEILLSLPQFQDAFTTESLDVLMFTDGGISNLSEVLEFFAERAQLNRATIVLAHGYDQKLADDYGDKIKIEKVDHEKDIPEICRKATKRSLSHHAEQAEAMRDA